MDYHAVFSLLAAGLGLLGSVFLSIGVLLPSHKNLVRSTYHYSPMAWPSRQIISSIAKSRAFTLIGITQIIMAFLTQVTAIIFIERDILFPGDKEPVTIVFLVLLFFAIISYLIAGEERKYHERAMAKIIVKDYCTKRFEGKKIDASNIKGLEDMIQQYFAFQRKESENPNDFIRRVAAYVKWDIPNGASFSEPKETVE